MASGLLIYDQHKCLRVWMRVAQGSQVCAELCVFDAEQSSNCRIINVARDSTELHKLDWRSSPGRVLVSGLFGQERGAVGFE